METDKPQMEGKMERRTDGEEDRGTDSPEIIIKSQRYAGGRQTESDKLTAASVKIHVDLWTNYSPIYSDKSLKLLLNLYSMFVLCGLPDLCCCTIYSSPFKSPSSKPVVHLAHCFTD